MSEAFKCRVCVGIARAEVFKRRQVRGVQLQVETKNEFYIYMHVVMMIINLNSSLVCMYICM